MSDSRELIHTPNTAGAAQSFVESEFGGPVTEKDSTYTSPATGAQRLITANPERVSLTLMNLGAVDAYVSPNNDVAADHGIYLPNGGGFISMNVRADSMLPTREWWVYSVNVNASIYVLELFRYDYT